MLSTFEAENRHLDKHAQPELKKRCARRKKNVYQWKMHCTSSLLKGLSLKGCQPDQSPQNQYTVVSLYVAMSVYQPV